MINLYKRHDRRNLMEEQFRSGFVSVIGRPNVGKSTLINQIVGEKVSIVTNKIQTTRQSIQGILTTAEMQLIMIDTPGVHKPKHQLGQYMVDVSVNTLEDVDLVLFMINANESFGKGDAFILQQFKKVSVPVFLIINKVDLIHPDQLFPIIDQYKDKYDFTEVIPISAMNGNNIPKLLKLIKSLLPIGPKFFDENDITNRSEQFLISELIREKVLLHTEEEIPHSINVVIESMEINEHHKRHINATIITERDSQKGILIGKKGQMLKRIGKEARREIEKLLNQKVYLELWIKVKKDWRNKQSILLQYGFDDSQI